MIFPLNYYWAFFSNTYLSIYPFAAIICILLFWFLKNKWKHEMINYLYVFNCIVPLLVLFGFIFFAAELFIAWYGQNPYEWYTFKENRTTIFGPYGWSYWIMLGNYLVPQLLWFKKLRKSIVATLVVTLFLSLGIWFERLIIWITSTYRDYLPSSWSTYYDTDYFLRLLLNISSFVVLSSIVYWLFYKRKKLPFPSAILSYSVFFIPYFLFQCIPLFN